MDYIKVNNQTYEIKSAETTSDTITVFFENKTADALAEIFDGVTAFELSDSDGTVYGIYKDLAFVNASVYDDNTASVTMRIKSDIEVRLERLENEQEVQDGAIAELGEVVSTIAEGGLL